MKKYDKASRAKRRARQRALRVAFGVISGLMFLLVLGTVGSVDAGTTLTFGVFLKAVGYMVLMAVSAWLAGGMDYLVKGE